MRRSHLFLAKKFGAIAVLFYLCRKIFFMNKTFVILVFLYILLSACSGSEKNSPSSDKQAKGHICVENTCQSFGAVRKKDVNNVILKFNFNNTGNIPVTISKIDVSCGCISASLSSETILPGAYQVLFVTLNQKSQIGHINKTVFINSNADNPIMLVRIKGDILE